VASVVDRDAGRFYCGRCAQTKLGATAVIEYVRIIDAFERGLTS
jgi:hypothetical protein